MSYSTKLFQKIRPATKNGNGYTFTGMGNVANYIDVQGDDTQPGAWARDIAENGNKRPLLFNHDVAQPVGFVLVADTAEGLKVTHGQLTRGVQRAEELRALIADGVIDAMSVGYDTVKSTRGRDGVRKLVECKLMEVSLVLWPANVRARITEIRSQDPRKLADVLARIRNLRALVDRKNRAELTELLKLGSISK